MSSEKKKRQPFTISRRSFLKATGVTGITLFAAGLTKPSSRLFDTPEVKPPIESEGVQSEKFVNTSCLNCPARCATTVRVVNGKAVRITGNALSKVSEGEICPRGHIGLQVLYDEERITSPLKRTNPSKGRNENPGWTKISWDEALNAVTNRLRDIRNSGKPEQLAIFSGLNSRSNEDLIGRFAAAYGTPNLVTDDALENEAEKVGRWLADGNYSHIAYDLGKSNYILSFGGSIVESERPLARNLRMWGKIRRERPTRAKVVVVDPRYSVTAARSDLWLKINPGTDGVLALAIANVIIIDHLYDDKFVADQTTGFENFRFEALKYSPETAADITGIDAETIRQIAHEFAQTRPAIAWVGRGAAGWPHGAMTCYNIFCLNALVGSIDIQGGITYQVDPPYREMPGVSDDNLSQQGLKQTRLDETTPGLFNKAISANLAATNIAGSKPYPVKMGIGFNSNFDMTAPGNSVWDEALKKLPYFVHVAPFVSEMAMYADIVLPATTFLEEWGYDHSTPGSGFAELKIKQPVVEVNPGMKNIGDAIFEIATRLGGTIGKSFVGIGDDSAGFVQYRTENLISWPELKNRGVWIGPEYQYEKYGTIFKTESRKFELDSNFLVDPTSSKPGLPRQPRYEPPVFIGNQNEFPLVLTTYQPVLAIENGSQNYPWAQEIFLVMHGVGWTSLAEINPETADSLHINNGDEVWVESPCGRLKMKAKVTGWVSPEIVAVARGQGHFAPGQWQKGIGVNPNDITGLGYDALSGQSALYNTRVKIYRA